MDETQDLLRFPVGKFKMKLNPSDSELKTWVETIGAFPGRLRALVSPLSSAQVETPYRPGGWTVKQVVHHLADSHTNAFIRLKAALTEDSPVIKPYLQDAWAMLPDSTLPVSISLDLLENLHARWHHILLHMQTSDWSRGYIHPEHNRFISLQEFVAMYAWHCNTHYGHISIVAGKP